MNSHSAASLLAADQLHSIDVRQCLHQSCRFEGRFKDHQHLFNGRRIWVGMLESSARNNVSRVGLLTECEVSNADHDLPAPDSPIDKLTHIKRRR